MNATEKALRERAISYDCPGVRREGHGPLPHRHAPPRPPRLRGGHEGRRTAGPVLGEGGVGVAGHARGK